MLIDAKNISQPKHFAQFLSNANDTIMISVAGRSSMTSDKAHFIETVLSLMIDDNEIVQCSSADTIFELTGYDINWWKQTSRRSNKLYKAVVKDEPARTYKVGVATLTEGRLSQIVTHEGDKDNVIQFINEELKTRYIDDFLKMNVVLNLAYREGDENDITQWYSLTELEEMGAIKL